ncbi:4-hydroxybenzoyl-CoA thioesterase [Arenimonas soli]|uniref:4-hydroxybenzoyl-CoA thioesterase n=1 Tax=Arenimonas soli TaxID=2269504 RepID=A0ABQ1HF20_9GAMM|nr:acyl-CoA thioesterase [Arenimonas soli]GGA74697.1 4-hydroxybenzoyl-CoA thioesterase [Arenimonas soli]
MKTEFSAEVALTPAFHDIDPMEVVWHGHYVKYFELARCALLQSFDYDYPQMRASGFAWPIVDLRAKYVRSARYGQSLVVRATLVEWENRLKIDYQVRDADTGEVLTRATSIQVAVDVATGEMCFASPNALLERLGKAT